MTVAARSTLEDAVLDGRYRIDRVIAHGGMSTVYRATDTRLERTVAIKVMDPALASDQTFLERFSREARAVAQVNHRNVVAVYDQGSDDGHVYLVMEYVPGKTLRQVLYADGRLDAPQALTVLENVLAGLAAAHQKGLVHRDIKPENILLGEDGGIRVVDFGLARAVETSTITQTGSPLLGTVAYLAPEQISQNKADARTDVYSAGVVAFEMLTGTPPFDGGTAANIAYRHVHEDVPSPSSMLPSSVEALPAPVDEMVRHATARDPGARPVDAGAFLSEVLTVRADCGYGYEPIPLPRVEDGSPTTEVPLAIGSGAVPVGDTDDPDTGSERRGKVGRFRRARAARRARKAQRAGLQRRIGRPGRRFALITFGVLLTLTLAGAGLAWWWLSGFTAAPRLVGMTAEQATTQAEAAGFTVEFGEEAFSETVPRGQVAQTTPEPGERTREGGEILAQMSKGKERYIVPSLAGRSVSESEAALGELTLVISGTDEAYHDTVPAGAVISSRPEAGTQLRRNDEVILVVSTGPAPVELRDYTGKQVSDAVTALTDNGLKVEQREEYDNEVSAGLVVSQDPGAGTAYRGDTINLVVSKGPEIVTVPNLSGITYEKARQRLADLGLETRKAIDVPGGSGLVLQQTPGAGTEVQHGSTVTLFIF